MPRPPSSRASIELGVGEVRDEVLATDLGGRFLGSGLVPVEQQHGGAVVGEASGHGTSDAARGTGDQGGVPGQCRAHGRDAT